MQWKALKSFQNEKIIYFNGAEEHENTADNGTIYVRYGYTEESIVISLAEFEIIKRRCRQRLQHDCQ